MKYLKNTIKVVLVLALVGISFIIKTFYDAGQFKKITPHFNGAVNSIAGVLSSEDITVHPETAMAFISSADRRAWWSGNTRVRQGAIYGFDLNSKNPRLVDLTADFDKEFNPHGIGLWTGEDGDFTLFVINRRGHDHFVEIFDNFENKLIHRKTVENTLMHSPNDIIPVSPNAFYVTNDHGNTSAMGRMVEEYFQLARSSVLYYDGKEFRTVAKGLAYANGINVSSDGKTIYVTAAVGRKVHVYDRNSDSGDLKLQQSLKLGTAPDNIEVDKRGHLWIGSHPKLLTFVKYSKNPKILSPSQVIKVVIQESGKYTVEEIYLNNGKPLSGSSVAAVFENQMLIGSVFDDHFLLCKMKITRSKTLLK